MAQNEASSSAACLCIPVVENYQNRKANLCTLKLQLRKLKRLEDNLEERLRRNENFGDNLQIWWRAAQDFQQEVEARHFDDKVDQRCLRGYMPNCFARYSNGKQILEMISKANDLLQEFDERYFSPSLLTDVKGRTRPCTRLIGIQAAEIIELIWYFLKKGNNVNIIGIYGVAGTGKTSIVSQIHNRALEEKRNHKFNMVRQINNPRKCFDYVFWVDVGSESNTIESLQQRIAVEVDIKPFEDSEDAIKRAATLSNVLINKGSYLLILDDMWTSISLKDIGIPEPMAENGCKIIITSGSVEVCRSMKSDKDVKVELLSNDDAWALFAYEVGPDFINMSWEAKTIAQNVLRECSRLPLGIITVARTLRCVTDSLCWEQTLTTLRESTKNVVEMDEKLFENLRFSYERLSDGTSNGQTKSCFLYCALYPEDYHIDTKELIECWMWEGLLGDAGRIKAKMQQGEMVLKKLKDARLIEGVYHEDGAEEVTMHHLIREMAIRITKTRPCFLLSSGANEMKPPDEWPQDVERVSLMRNELKELPSKPKCPKLNTLLLQHNYSLTSKFCNDFFTEMPLLRVLNLSYIGISSLPDLSKLKNLQALLVCGCWKLKHLPSLQGLEALEVLNISYTGITKLPDGMEELTNLRRIDLSYTKVTNFRSRLLRAFEHLEELLMYGCNFFWGEACIEELKAFQNLVVLEVNFSNEHVFDAYVRSDHWYQLTSFKFCVSGIYSGTLGNYDISITKNSHVHGFPVLLPDHTTDLHMTRCEDITQLQIPGRLENLKVVDISDCGNLKILFKHTVVCRLPNLQQIAIKRCQSVEKVIEDEENNDTKAVFLPHLLTLTLVDLPKLECIYDGVVVWDSLQTIEVLMCKNLKRIPLSADGQKTIRGEEAWFRSLEWDDPNSQTPFEIWSETTTAPEEQLSRQTALSSSSNSSSSKATDFPRTTGYATTNIETASNTEGTSNSNSNDDTFSAPIRMVPFRRRFSDKDDICLTGKILPTPNLKIYSIAELKRATRKFRLDMFLGSGGFGTVYKGWVDRKTLAPSKVGTGMAVAIKKLYPESVQGQREWQSEVTFLGRLSHPNLVKLLGYCCKEQERFLVYEFMPKGSLDRHLFKRSAIEALSWDVRLKIAIGAARGLAFLHISENIVFYCGFKASCILLDGDYNAKLSDFGLARLTVTTRIMGTSGYTAPEYIATGHLSAKSDVYSFGVVLLELLTGLQALDTQRPYGQRNLVDWAKPLLFNRRELKSVMDSRIEGQYSLKAALEAAQLILNCLELEPGTRPSMREVVKFLERIEAMEVKPKESKSSFTGVV